MSATNIVPSGKCNYHLRKYTVLPHVTGSCAFSTSTLCAGKNLQLCVYSTCAFSGVVVTEKFHYLEPLWRTEFATVSNQRAHFQEFSGLKDFTMWSLCGERNLQVCVYPTRAFWRIVWTEAFHDLEPLWRGIRRSLSTQRAQHQGLFRLGDFTTRNLCGGRNLPLCVDLTCAFSGVFLDSWIALPGAFEEGRISILGASVEGGI